MLVFMVGSAVAALSTDLTALVAARVFQAVGAGALVPISIAMVGDLFPPERRGLPLGIMGASAEAGGVIGPLWGGLIVRYLHWSWVFWTNIPLGLMVLVPLMALVASSPRFPGKVDYLGGVLIAAGSFDPDTGSGPDRRARPASGGLRGICHRIGGSVHLAAKARR